jgi:hypothetical protein
MPEEGPAVARGGCDAALDAIGDDLGRDKLCEGLELRKHPVAERIVEVERDDEVGHDDSLAHVDSEVVEAGDRDVTEAEGRDLVVAGAPVADGGGVIALGAENGGERLHPLVGGGHGFAVRIHLPNAVGVRVIGGHHLHA